VIDFVVISRRQLDQYRSALSDLRIGYVVLAPEPAVALSRDRGRSAKRVTHHWLHLAPILRGKLAGVGLRVDNAGLTPEQTVDRVPAGRQRAILPADLDLGC